MLRLSSHSDLASACIPGGPSSTGISLPALSALIGMYVPAGSYSPNEDTAVSGWLALEPSSSSQPEFRLAVSGIPDETGASWVASFGR